MVEILEGGSKEKMSEKGGLLLPFLVNSKDIIGCLMCPLGRILGRFFILSKYEFSFIKKVHKVQNLVQRGLFGHYCNCIR